MLRRTGAPLTLALVLTLSLAACSPGDSPSPSAAAECSAPVDGVITVHADNLLFDTECLSLPAGEEVTIRLVNDDSAPHNITIFADADAGTQLFAGENIDGGESIDYVVPAQEAGTYYFECTIHPAMNGSVVVQ